MCPRSKRVQVRSWSQVLPITSLKTPSKELLTVRPKTLTAMKAPKAMCRGEISAVIARLMSKCLWSGWKHGTIIRTGITYKKILLKKSIEFSMALKESVTRYKQKTEMFLVTTPRTCWKPFSLITWITKLWIKQPVERSQQILANYGHINWKAFEMLRLFVEAFTISWFIWQSIFDHF